MNQSVKRQPSRCKMIYSKLNFAKMGTTLVPKSMKTNSMQHMPIIVPATPKSVLSALVYLSDPVEYAWPTSK